MFIRRSVGVAAALLTLTTVAALPAASAAPAPGDPCSGNDSTSADGTLWCNQQAEIWMNELPGGRMAVVGQPCPAAGQVAYAAREQTVTCRQTAGGLAWEPRG